MALLDIFQNDAFHVVEMTDALESVPFAPSFIGSLGIFEENPIRTEYVAIEMRDNTLRLVPTTPRGSPLPTRGVEPRNVRAFKTPRVANGDRLNASEISGIRAFGTDSELESVTKEVLRRQAVLRGDVELTHEHMRLGALQGIVVDSDGTSEIYNWFTEFGITPNTEIDFNLDADGNGAIRALLTQLKRDMKLKSGGTWVEGRTRIGALASDEFYDALLKNKEIRETYLNQQEAGQLRGEIGESFVYAGVQFFNYQGTDDGSTIAIPANKVKFFPIGAPGAFKVARSPGESFDFVNTPGKEFYAMQIPDKDRNSFVDLEVYSYPLFIAQRPQMLFTGKVT